MTYNFDPDQWYEREYRILVMRRDQGSLNPDQFEEALNDLNERHEKMLDRLDGTYVLPGEPQRRTTED